MGEGEGKWGQSTSNLIRGRTVRVTAGGRQVSEREYKGEVKGDSNGSKRVREESKRKATSCIYVTIICVLKMIEDNECYAMYIHDDNCMNDVLYIIIIGMNAVDNLNFCLGYK